MTVTSTGFPSIPAVQGPPDEKQTKFDAEEEKPEACEAVVVSGLYEEGHSLPHSGRVRRIAVGHLSGDPAPARTPSRHEERAGEYREGCVGHVEVRRWWERREGELVLVVVDDVRCA